MGFRYRKSINLGGGFRVNISKHGIGYSWGTKGYRVTKTANGKLRQTVSVPGTGLSYVDEHSIGGSKKRKQSSANTGKILPSSFENFENFEQVTSTDASYLQSAEYDELFKRIKIFKAGAIAIAVIAVLCAKIVWLFYLAAAILLAYCILFRCSIEYEFDDYASEKWKELRSVWNSVASSKSLQHVVTTAKSKNSRVTGGIKKGIQTEKMKSGNRLPWYVKTNIKPIVFKSKKMKLAIMPDRMLIFDRGMGALSYQEAKIDIYAYGLASTEAVPSDAEIAKYVWLYANNDGSPDKRFTDNRQIPVIKYGVVDITSADGLNAKLLFSNIKAADKLNDLLNKGKKETN